jgi:hypothetical protein
MQPDQRFSPPRGGSTVEFDRLLRRVVRDILLPRTLEGRSLPQTHRESGKFRLKPKRPSKPTDMGEFATGCWH